MKYQLEMNDQTKGNLKNYNGNCFAMFNDSPFGLLNQLCGLETGMDVNTDKSLSDSDRFKPNRGANGKIESYTIQTDGEIPQSVLEVASRYIKITRLD